MSTTTNRRRAYLPESYMHDVAFTLANREVTKFEIRPDDSHGSTTYRTPTAKECQLLENLFYSALLGLNWGETNRSNPDCVRAILDTMEFTFDVLFPGVNGYLAFFIPLQHYVCSLWPEESDALTA